MKKVIRIVEKIDIECMPCDLTEAIQDIQSDGYTLKRKKCKDIWGQAVWFLVGEKEHQCNSEFLND